MKLLFFAENPGQLADGAGLISHLSKVSGEVEAYALVLGEPKEHNYKQFKKIYYVLVERFTPEEAAIILDNLYSQLSPDLVAAPATKNGNDIVARISARHDIPMVTEAIEIEKIDGGFKLVRQILAGRAKAVYTAPAPVALTIPLKKFEAENLETGAEVEEVKPPATARTKIVEVKEKIREAVNIEEAEVVVGVGRGFKKKEDLRLAEELAEYLNGTVGCTRPIAADYGWLSEDRWIGISGKKIRPKLYLAIGISGAPQHMAAVMDAKVIVAVNKDKNAPVFQYADYGVVADLYKFVPILIEKIKERLGGK
ncbi:MAG: electron transfer flavoprotein subunit alpha/FixB family protein [Pyrodictiaceae archaeon]